jgi:hypothetical protein
MHRCFVRWTWIDLRRLLRSPGTRVKESRIKVQLLSSFEPKVLISMTKLDEDEKKNRKILHV